MKDLGDWQSKFEYCTYSYSLINKIRSMNKKNSNKVNLIEVKKAIYYAKKNHGNQKRETQEPYYSHPISVAEMVLDFCFDVNAIVAAILHDIVEDTPVSVKDLSRIFGSRVAEIVDRLTRFKLPNSKERISSEQLIMQAYKLNDAVVVLIKLLDKLHNLQTIYVKSPEKQQKTRLEVLKTFYLLSFKLDQNIVKKFEKYLNYIIPVQDHLIFSYGIYQLEFPTLQNNF